MAWTADLSLHYRRDAQGGTTAHDRHEGPLRVLQRLYPEGPGVCHHVLVHPPGGIVGGDELRVQARLEPGCHALVTTPGAARFYRSAGEPALQSATLSLEAGARLEWLPLETIAYDGCLAANRVRMNLAPGAQCMGWDLLALGLPAAGAPFAEGCFEQRLELPGVWLERGRLEGRDSRLLDSPLGLAGHRVLACLWFACGEAMVPGLVDALLASARETASGGPLARTAGATSPHPQLVLLRALAHRVEPAMTLLQAVRTQWRSLAWRLPANPPRVWRT